MTKSASISLDAREPFDRPATGVKKSPALRRRRRFRWDLLSIHIGLICVCAGMLLPFLWMVSTSLKPLEQTMESPPRLIPHPWRPENYARIFTNPNFHAALYTRNTLLIALLTVLGTTLSSAIVAYGFARISFRGRNLLFGIMLATIMIPFPITMVSVFRIFRWMDVHTIAWFGPHNPLRMLGTFKPLWLPAWFGSAFNIFLLRQFFITIPKELSEAARIDGCTEFGIFSRIVLPLAKPALAVVALFSFMYVWNDFLAPLVYIQRPEQYTLALGLEAFQNKIGGSEWNLLMAASVLICLPTLILFFLTQRTFIQGIATTGGKG
ncbi:MAG TPA: carbohydrate ABC transporter permease [Tepidisphaeraceae bacterium]|nr:carbohydrate ABC transporter permease [Tepidisphaeraceae bacterium]